MSRFKRIKDKTTKKSSVSINEKIDALNKELVKTGMLEEESPTNSTDGVYSTSTFVPPLPTIEADVPNSSGIGGEGFSQSTAGSGVSGDAPSYSSLDDLYNDDADRPIFQTPTGDGLPASFGVVKYPGFGAGDNFGIIEGGNIVRLVLGGFIAGGTRGAQYYVDIYNAFLATNEQNPGFYSDAQIEEKRVQASLATQVENIRIQAQKDGLEFNIPWQGYRSPQLFENLDGRTTFTHATKGLLVLSGFQLLGLPNRYVAQDARPPGVKDPLRRGLEDEPIYPGPIENLFNLGKRAFEWLKEKAEAADKRFDAMTAILDAIPPFLNFLAHQINPNSPWTEENPHPVNINDKEKEEITNDIEELFNEWGDERVDELNDGAPMTNKEQSQLNNKINSNKANASDDNLEGDIFDAEYNSARMTLNNVGNPKAFAGNIKTNKDGTKTPIAIDDTYVFEGDMDASAPGAPKIIKALINNDKVQNSIKNSGLDYPYRKDAANEPGVDTEVTTKDGKKITINQKEVILNKNMPIRLNLTPGILPPPKVETKESYITEGVGLGLYDPEAMNVDLADIRKGIMPEYPKKPPAEMIDGYHEKSPLRPKLLEKEPYVKITKVDLIRNHRIKPSEVDEMMNTINMVNAHIKAHPEDLIHAQMRYPKDDPRLAELNWKMDQMLQAGEEYMDTNFKENQTLYKRATDRTKKNIKLTDPEYVQQHYDELRGTTKPKKIKLVGRLGKHLNKYESKSFFKHVNSKDFRKTSERKIKIEEHKKQVQKEIQTEYEQTKNDWRKDLGNNTY